jgi:hypothetical protein
MGEMRNAYKTYLESLQGIYHVGDLDVGGRVILKWILEK